MKKNGQHYNEVKLKVRKKPLNAPAFLFSLGLGVFARGFEAGDRLSSVCTNPSFVCGYLPNLRVIFPGFDPHKSARRSIRIIRVLCRGGPAVFTRCFEAGVRLSSVCTNHSFYLRSSAKSAGDFPGETDCHLSVRNLCGLAP